MILEEFFQHIWPTDEFVINKREDPFGLVFLPPTSFTATGLPPIVPLYTPLAISRTRRERTGIRTNSNQGIIVDIELDFGHIGT